MSRPVHRVSRARQAYECAWACGTPIHRGQQYVRASLPPRTAENDGPRWWSIAVHGHTRDACPTRVPSDIDPRVKAAERPDLRCQMKTGAITAEMYCARHGRAAGWPCQFFGPSERLR